MQKVKVTDYSHFGAAFLLDFAVIIDFATILDSSFDSFKRKINISLSKGISSD